jgi:urease accessory protein
MSPPGRPKGEYRSAKHEGSPGIPNIASLARLLQLASPTLPIGAYSYSQGLEWAVEAGIVHDAATAGEWIGDLLELSLATGEAAVLARLITAQVAGDSAAFTAWNTWFRASRETRELRAETEQMGASLVSVARDLRWLDADATELVALCVPITLPGAFALAARRVELPADAVIAAYLWSWLDNQVLAAIKTIPLGQVAGQRLLGELGERIAHAVERAQIVPDEDVASFTPGLALASARHETQYSRLFRS